MSASAPLSAPASFAADPELVEDGKLAVSAAAAVAKATPERQRRVAATRRRSSSATWTPKSALAPREVRSYPETVQMPGKRASVAVEPE
jgi:hypothetical protein